MNTLTLLSKVNKFLLSAQNQNDLTLASTIFVRYVKSGGALDAYQRTKFPVGLIRKFLIFFMCLVLFFNCQNAFSENDSWYREYVDNVGEMIYKVAWPTAIYKSVSFNGVEQIDGNIYLLITVSGISKFDGDSLWTELRLKLSSNMKIEDFEWGKNNAVIAGPGETISTFVKVVDSLNEEYKKSSQAQ